MARRPNYSFERTQRDRAKVAKREAKREARNARKNGEPVPGEGDAPDSAAPTRSSEPSANVVLTPQDTTDTDTDEATEATEAS